MLFFLKSYKIVVKYLQDHFYGEKKKTFTSRVPQIKADFVQVEYQNQKTHRRHESTL